MAAPALKLVPVSAPVVDTEALTDLQRARRESTMRNLAARGAAMAAQDRVKTGPAPDTRARRPSVYDIPVGGPSPATRFGL